MSNLEDLVDSHHKETVFNSLNDQRMQGVFCDVTIVVEDVKFKAHRNVLAASSPYFRQHFLRPSLHVASHIMELNDLKADVFTEILNFIYSSKVKVKRKETFHDLATAGKMLGIPFLENLQHDNQSNKSKTSSVHSAKPVVSPTPFALYSSSVGLNTEISNKKGDDHAIASGPRITNAFSIVETENSDGVFSPLDLRANLKRTPEGIKVTDVLRGNHVSSRTESLYALAEHSYAVSSSSDTFLRKDLSLEHGTPPVSKDGKENQPFTIPPTIQAPKVACSSPKKALLKKYAGLSNTELETPQPDMEINSDQQIMSILNSHQGVAFQFSRKNENDISKTSPNNIPDTESLNSPVALGDHLQVPKKHHPPFKCKNCSKPFTHHKHLGRHEHICLRAAPLLLKSEEAQMIVDKGTTDNMSGTLYTDQLPLLPMKQMSNFSIEGDTVADKDHFVKIVNGQIFYICNVCQRTYLTLSSLRRHSNVHSWTKTYPCHYCNKVFALAEYRTKHEIWHTGDRRYQCILCLETFMTYCILKNHQKSFHGIDPRLGVRRKTANGGLKSNVYPHKLYRLLPMKGRNTSRTAQNSVSLENVNTQNCDTISTPCITLDSDLPAYFQEIGDNLNSTVTLINTCENSEATTLNTVSAVPRELQSDIKQPPVPEKSASPIEKEFSSSKQELDALGSQSQNVSTITSHTFSVPSVIMHSSRVSSVIVHGNEVASLETRGNQISKPDLSQAIKEERGEESDNVGDSNTNTKSVTCSIPEHPMESDEIADSKDASKGTTDIVQGESKTETYIAKPALPSTFISSGVEPLCQITVRIGNEAMVRRHIPESNLFYKKGRSKYFKYEQRDCVQECKAENRERTSGRLRRSSDCSRMNEMWGDPSDHDSNDESWHPYYTYKPKKRSKHLKNVRKVKKRKKLGNRVAESLSENEFDSTSALEHIPTESTTKEDPKEEALDTQATVCDGDVHVKESENAATEDTSKEDIKADILHTQSKGCDEDKSVEEDASSLIEATSKEDIKGEVHDTHSSNCEEDMSVEKDSSTPTDVESKVEIKVKMLNNQSADCDIYMSSEKDVSIPTKDATKEVLKGEKCDTQSIDFDEDILEEETSTTSVEQARNQQMKVEILGSQSTVSDMQVSVEEDTSAENVHPAPSFSSCELCQMVFSNPSTLKVHMRCHTGERPYCCKTCDKCFSFLGHLKKHERIHLHVKKYICQYCGKAFALNQTLVKHERTHTGEKLYKCQFCPRSFLYLCTKKDHEQKHELENGVKGFVGLQCSEVCETPDALSMHQNKHFLKNLQHQDSQDGPVEQLKKRPKYFTYQSIKETPESKTKDNSANYSSSDCTTDSAITSEESQEDLTPGNGEDSSNIEKKNPKNNDGGSHSKRFFFEDCFKQNSEQKSWESWQSCQRDLRESGALNCQVANTINNDNLFEKSSLGYL